ncbi:MAG: IS630 family transposase [Patescibacteria group bacterium]
MPFPVQMDSEEEKLLLQHYQKASNSLIQQRAHSILLYQQGYSPYQISGILYRSEKTVREWIRAFSKERIASIFPRYTDNENAAKLTRAQKKEIENVLSQKPSDYGIPKEFWDVSTLKRYIKAEFGVEYESPESYRLIFLLHNYSFHLPDTFDIHRNEKTIAKRMREIKKEIRPLLKNNGWLVFASDESRIIWETIIRRLWLPKGKKSIIKVERKRKAQSFIGFLNLKTGEELLYQLSWQKQDTIIPVLEVLTKKYSNKRICIIWDNARFHKGNKIKAKLSTTLKAIHLISLPPYAPDHNPQEKVWKYGKDKLANNQRGSLEETVAAFTSIITGRNYSYHI